VSAWWESGSGCIPLFSRRQIAALRQERSRPELRVRPAAGSVLMYACSEGSAPFHFLSKTNTEYSDLLVVMQEAR
jgi:hypothetical protein